jgi:hypothetical protein
MGTINTCSVWDLQCTLKLGLTNITVQNFVDAIEKEKSSRNRVTIVKLLERGLKAKKQGKERI